MHRLLKIFHEVIVTIVYLQNAIYVRILAKHVGEEIYGLRPPFHSRNPLKLIFLTRA